MSGSDFSNDSISMKPYLIVMMFLLMSMSSVFNTVSAVGSNQNDIGTSGGDLPDNLSSTTSIPNLIFSNSIKNKDFINLIIIILYKPRCNFKIYCNNFNHNPEKRYRYKNFPS